MRTDSTDASHPVDTEVKSPEDIEGIFDDITYEKAAAIIRMLLGHIGQDRFREVLRVYFSRFMYKCVDVSDLRAVVNEVLGRSYDEFFDSWIHQSGFPVVVLEDDLTIAHQRFTPNGLLSDHTCQKRRLNRKTLRNLRFYFVRIAKPNPQKDYFSKFSSRDHFPELKDI
jgi:aminopeptidase N